MSQDKREKPLPEIVLQAGNDLGKLANAIRYPDFEVREATAWKLGEIGTFECIAPLVDALKDPDAVVRESAAYALGRIKELPNINRKLSMFEDTPDDVWAMNELQKLGKDRELRVRIAAAEALKTYGKEMEVTTPEIATSPRKVSASQVAPPATVFDLDIMKSAIAGAKKEYPPLRRNKPIPQIILDAEYDFIKLEAASKHKETAVREAAAWALGVMADPDGVSILIQMFHDPEVIVRESAARALGGIRYPNDTRKPVGRFEDMTDDRKASDALQKALKDKEANVRASSAAALANYGKPEVAKTLLTLLQDTNSTIRAAASTGLSGCPYPEVLPALIRMLRDDDFFTRLCAARSLGRLGDAQALEPLLEMLHDTNASVRLNTARALADLGQRGAGTMQFWLRAMDQLMALGTTDPSEEVQQFVQEAIVRLQPRITPKG